MEEGRNEKKKVMVAIDEGEYSLYALQWTLKNLVHSVSNYQVLIFTVQPLSDFGYIHASTFGRALPELISSVQENQRKVAVTLLERAKEICNNHGITAEILTEVGDPKVAICESVEKFNVQLLVLGSQGRGALKRALLGSVSNYCVQNAKCPVLVVKK